MIAEQDYFFWF